MSRSDREEAHRRSMTAAARYREHARRDPDHGLLPVWECDQGHGWDATLRTAQNIRCINCALQRRELATRRLREIAKERGGALLSRGYVDESTPLDWQCAYGHVWSARPALAPRLWCAECARTIYSRYR
jgi:hypothetical protein